MDTTDYADRMLESVRTAETHVETEFRDALPETLATVSASPRYAMMPVPGKLDVISTSAGVRTFYETSRAAFAPTATRRIRQIATDWYVFYEGVRSRSHYRRRPRDHRRSFPARERGGPVLRCGVTPGRA